jgi:hypothetical protein
VEPQKKTECVGPGLLESWVWRTREGGVSSRDPKCQGFSACHPSVGLWVRRSSWVWLLSQCQKPPLFLFSLSPLDFTSLRVHIATAYLLPHFQYKLCCLHPALLVLSFGPLASKGWTFLGRLINFDWHDFGCNMLVNRKESLKRCDNYVVMFTTSLIPEGFYLALCLEVISNLKGCSKLVQRSSIICLPRFTIFNKLHLGFLGLLFQ